MARRGCGGYGRRMRRVLPVLLPLARPASAGAALPDFSSHKIVPGKSIGGVKVGMAGDAAIAKWGGTEMCPAPYTTGDCTFRSDNNRGYATLSIRDGKVKIVDISLDTDDQGRPIYKGPLMKLKARKKVGLGSTLRKVLKAYPKLQGSGSGGQLGSGAHATTFSTSSGRIYEITLGSF